MTVFTNIFGGDNIAPSSVSYASVTLSTASTQYYWPLETSANNDLIATIMDVTSNTAGNILKLGPANEISNGQTILFNNPGANSFIVQDYAGTQILNVSPGTTWQIYLTDNSTTAGTWRAFQYGASVSSANASALAGTGIIALGSLLSQSMPVLTYSINHTLTVPDRAYTFLWTSGVGTFTLPLASTAGNNWFVQFKNAGTGVLTIQTVGANVVDNAASISLQPLESCIVLTDGVNYYSLGLGQSAIFAFDYTTINVAGTGNYVLSGAELNRVAYEFTGVLTGNRSVVVPATVQQYWIDNATTGAFTLTVKTSAGTGIGVSQGSRGIYYCDGSDVVDADTTTASFPITVAQGGTGATTAGGALINLGGTAVGIPIFEAANQQAAWTALGVAPAGVVNGGTY